MTQEKAEAEAARVLFEAEAFEAEALALRVETAIHDAVMLERNWTSASADVLEARWRALFADVVSAALDPVKARERALALIEAGQATACCCAAGTPEEVLATFLADNK